MQLLTLVLVEKMKHFRVNFSNDQTTNIEI